MKRLPDSKIFIALAMSAAIVLLLPLATPVLATPAIPPEDFTTYTKVDPENRVTITSNEVNFSGANFRGTDTHVYKDMGANYFDGDFEHLLTIGITSFVTYAMPGVWMLSNDIDDQVGMISGNKDFLNFEFYRGDSGLFRLRIHEYTNGIYYEDNWNGASIGATYYVKIKREEGIGTYGRLSAYIYSDPDKTNLLKTLQLDLHAKLDFRYIYALNTHNDSQVYRASGFVKDLSLSPIPATIDFDPDTLNLQSKGKTVTTYIQLPEGYDVEQIDITSIKLNGVVLALGKPTEINDYNKDGVPDLMVKFDRSSVQAILAAGDRVKITITGKITEVNFEGSDTIKVIK